MSHSNINSAINKSIDDITSACSEISNNSINSIVQDGSGMISNIEPKEVSTGFSSYLTKKNIYILLGLIILGCVIYFFIFKKNKKKEEPKDVYVNIPNDELPLPDNTSYNNIVHPEINNTTEDNISNLNQPELTALEIKNISEQLEKMKKEVAV